MQPREAAPGERRVAMFCFSVVVAVMSAIAYAVAETFIGQALAC